MKPSENIKNPKIHNSQSISLRTKIVLLCLGSLTLTGLLNSYFFGKVKNEFVTNTKKIVQSTSDNLGKAIAAQLYERYGDVQAFAVNPRLLSNSKKEIVDALNTYAALYGIYDLILVIDKNGRLVAVNDKDPAGKDIHSEKLYEEDYSKETWFQETLAGHYTIDTAKGFDKTYVEEPSFDRFVAKVYGGTHYGSGFTTQLVDKSGKTVGIVSNRANIKWIQQPFAEAVASIDFLKMPSIDLHLFNRSGIELFVFDAEEDRVDSKVEFHFNPEVLGKSNLGQSGYGIVNELSNKGPVTDEVESPKDGKMIAGATLITGDKMPSMLGWGTLVSARKQEALGEAAKSVKQFYLFMCLSILASALLASFLATRWGQLLSTLSENLRATAESTKDASTTLSLSAEDLASMSTEQASAIQESASALAEIASMINQTALTAKQSQEAAKEANEKSQAGKLTMDRAVSSMDSIEEASRKLSSIATVINEIQSKTSVINDIVFKTQLLSFNASIEAARAGQHGKGFAVVAEEVGSLALLSGKAANEIETLLAESKRSVDSTLSTIIQRVKDGKTISEEAAITFKEIAAGVSTISSQIKAINDATLQQDTGVRQTQKAMEQLDVAATKNNNSAQKSKEITHDLSDKASLMLESTASIEAIIMGASTTRVKQNTDTLNSPTALIASPPATPAAEPTDDTQSIQPVGQEGEIEFKSAA